MNKLFINYINKNGIYDQVEYPFHSTDSDTFNDNDLIQLLNILLADKSFVNKVRSVEEVFVSEE